MKGGRAKPLTGRVASSSGAAGVSREDLCALGAAAAADAVRSGRLRAVDLARACIARVERLEPRVEAWVHFDPAKTLAQALAVDEAVRRGEDPGPLAGVPVGVKDTFNTRDMPTCMGSPIWEGYVPNNDARSVFHLRRAGGIVPGKTVTAEFAVHAPGKTRNPHDPARSPGTSSSGSAAAVACRMVPVALGTQTAGSIIRPASYCGVYGSKPSFGLIPRTGTLKTTDSLDQIGFFAHAAEDLPLVLDVLRVHGTDYPISHALLNDPVRQSPAGPRWKVGVVTSTLWVWDLAKPYAQAALRGFADTLANHGADVDEAKVPDLLNTAHPIHETIYDKTLAYYFQQEYENPHLVSNILKGMIAHGQRVTPEQYVEALEAQRGIARALDRWFEDWDIVLTLSTAGEAPLFGHDDIPDSCLIWSLCGVPAINLPVFAAPGGLPFGAQVVARRYNDPLLLRFLRFLREGGLIRDAAPAPAGQPDGGPGATRAR